MSNRLWITAAIAFCVLVALIAAAVGVYIGVLVARGSHPLFGVLAGGLAFHSMARGVVAFMSWWWPGEADPDWLDRHPPLLRLDRLRKRT